MPPADTGSRGLAVRELACSRGGHAVFSGLTFTLPPGTALQVRGSNGSGKSSLLRLLCGLLPPEHGELRWDGRAFGASDSGQGAAVAVAFMGHASGLCGELTARENLRFSAGMLATPAADGDVATVLQALRIEDCADQLVRRLSQGQRQRVALARVLLARRPLWLLDEPCAALDAGGMALFEASLSEHARAGGVAVIATHHALAGPEGALPAIDMDAYSDAAGSGRDRRA